MFELDAAAFEGDLTVAATAGILRGTPDAMANFHGEECDVAPYNEHDSDDGDTIIRGQE